MTEEDKGEPNPIELLRNVANKQAEQDAKLDALAKAVVALAERVGTKPEGQAQGGGDFFGFLKGLIEEGKGGKGVSLEQIAKNARYWAMLADAVGHYRRPTLPYSGADRFLMRAGARTVYRMTYQGVKSKPEEGKGEEPSDEELDKMLGFAEEKGEEERGQHRVK